MQREGRLRKIESYVGRLTRLSKEDEGQSIMARFCLS